MIAPLLFSLPFFAAHHPRCCLSAPLSPLFAPCLPKAQIKGGAAEESAEWWEQKEEVITKVDQFDQDFTAIDRPIEIILTEKCKDEDSRAKLSDFMKKWGKLVKTAYLGYNNLGPEGVKALAPALMHLTHITSLYLDDNSLDEASAALVFGVILKHHPNPENVRIYGLDDLESKRVTLHAYCRLLVYLTNDFNALALGTIPIFRSPPIQ